MFHDHQITMRKLKTYGSFTDELEFPNSRLSPKCQLCWPKIGASGDRGTIKILEYVNE